MQTIQRTRWLTYSCAEIYQLLTDVEQFTKIIRRIDSLKVLERNGDYGRVHAVIDLPGGKFIEAEGRVEGIHERTLQFETDAPFPLKILWELAPETQQGQVGTLVTYSVSIDLSPILAILPTLVLNGYLGADMERDLSRLEQALSGVDALL